MSENPSSDVSVDELIARAREARPGITPPDGFGAFVRSKLDDQTEAEKLQMGDLLLAFAACHGNAKALAAVEDDSIQGIGRIVGNLRLPAEALDELQQRVRTKLLVAEPGRAPRLLDYAGRAPLRSWVGVVATREGLSMMRSSAQPSDPDEVLMNVQSPSVGPELGYLKEHYREAFTSAFLSALGELSPRARNALRHHYVHGMTIDQIGSVYGIHRSSAARRVAKARDDLLAAVRRRMVIALNIATPEVESIMRMIESRIDVSLRGALDPAQPAEPEDESENDD